MNHLPCLPNKSLCEGCSCWTPLDPAGPCKHQLWERLTTCFSLPGTCPIGVALCGQSNTLDLSPNPKPFEVYVLEGLGVPIDFVKDFTVDPITGSAWGNRIFTSRLTTQSVTESIVKQAAEKAKAEFSAALQKLIADESEALSAIEQLARIRKTLRTKIQEMLDEPVNDPFSSWEDGRRDTLHEVLALLDGKLTKLME